MFVAPVISALLLASRHIESARDAGLLAGHGVFIFVVVSRPLVEFVVGVVKIGRRSGSTAAAASP